MKIDPTTAVEGFSPFTGDFPISKTKLPKYITLKIFSNLQPNDLYNMARTCKSIKQIITTIEPINNAFTALQLLKESYLMGKNIQSKNRDHISKKCEWLADIAIAIYPYFPQKGLLVAQEANQLVKTLSHNDGTSLFSQTCAAIAEKVAAYFPEDAEKLVTEAYNCIPKALTLKKHLEISSKCLRIFYICKKETFSTCIEHYKKEIDTLSDVLTKAECLLFLATAYPPGDEQKKKLIEESMAIICNLTNEQKQASQKEILAWESCVQVACISDRLVAQNIMKYFTEVIHEWKFPYNNAPAFIFIIPLIKLIEFNLHDEARKVASEILNHTEMLINDSKDTLLTQQLLVAKAGILQILNPIKAVDILLSNTNPQNEPNESKEINHLRILILFDIARNLPFLPDNEFEVCSHRIAEFLKTTRSSDTKILLIKSAYCISLELKSMQHSLEVHKESKQFGLSLTDKTALLIDELPAEIKSRTLGKIALCRTHYNLKQRAIAIQNNKSNIINIDLSHFMFKRVQNVLDKMEESFAKARVMAEIGSLMFH